MTKSSSTARSTGPTVGYRAETGVPSPIVWERVLDQLRMKLSERPSRTAVFGRAGLRFSKMYWMRRSPDLRASVIVKLSKALKVTPGQFLTLMVREAKTDRLGRIRF